MKEVKFRAWDKEEQSMIWYIETINFTNGRFDVYGLSTKNIVRWYFNVIPMQYTGLHDKNEKKIYDGDIVSAWSEGKHAIGEVKQRIDGLWIMYPAYQNEKMWGLCPNDNGKTTVEVIGNIYENPELLKGDRIC